VLFELSPASPGKIADDLSLARALIPALEKPEETNAR
jgi:hypothetical protein